MHESTFEWILSTVRVEVATWVQISNQSSIDPKHPCLAFQHYDSRTPMWACFHDEVILHEVLESQDLEYWCCDGVINVKSWSLWVKCFIALEYNWLVNGVLKAREQNVSAQLYWQFLDKWVINALLSVPLVVEVLFDSIPHSLIHSIWRNLA